MKYDLEKDYMLLEKAVPKSKAGLIIPGSDKMLPGQEATTDDIFRVLQVGPGDSECKIKVKKGDLVFIIGYLTTTSYKGEKIILGRARDIAMKIKEED